MKSPIQFAILLLCLLALLPCLASCTGSPGGEADVTATPESTAEPTPNGDRDNVPTSPSQLTFYENENAPIVKSLTRGTSEIVRTSDNGTMLKLHADEKKTVSVTLDYDGYMASLGLSPVNAEDYPYVTATVKYEKGYSSSAAFTFTSSTLTQTATSARAYSEVASGSGWQSLFFDMTTVKKWSGTLKTLVLSPIVDPAKKGETAYVYDITFHTSIEDALAYAADTEARMAHDNPVGKITETSPLSYQKKNAPDEDATVSMWFDHATEKVLQTDTAAGEMQTYFLYLAGNSIENFQFFLATGKPRNFRVEWTPFENENGKTLKTELYREEYNPTYDTAKTESSKRMVPEALPPVNGTITVNGENSQGFMVKVWAETDAEAGLYTATINIYDAKTGKHIKTADVYATVWNFSLSDETQMKTAFNMHADFIADTYSQYGMTDYTQAELYKIYYDFLLDNRMCAYVLPYSLYDSRVTDYLNNPRVTCFRVDRNNEGSEARASSVLAANPLWQRKGYYYLVDEPTNSVLLNELRQNTERLQTTDPNFRQVSPFFTNILTDDGDQINTLKTDLSIWCTKIFAFTPTVFRKTTYAQFLTTEEQDKTYGTFPERMAEEVKNGDELWVYFCWEPREPYVNWLISGDGCEPIVSMWQSKMVDATGVLYWGTDFWTENMASAPAGTQTVYGDGVLYYSGAAYGVYEPVSSHRLENIRLGLQDYQMLCMLEDLTDETTADALIAKVTRNVLTYTLDDDALHAVRVYLGNEIEKLTNR